MELPRHPGAPARRRVISWVLPGRKGLTAAKRTGPPRRPEDGPQQPEIMARFWPATHDTESVLPDEYNSARSVSGLSHQDIQRTDLGLQHVAFTPDERNQQHER